MAWYHWVGAAIFPPGALWWDEAKWAKTLVDERGELWEHLKKGEFRELMERPEIQRGLGYIGIGAGAFTGNPQYAAAGGGYLYQSITGERPPPEVQVAIDKIAEGEVTWDDIGSDGGRAILARIGKEYPELFGPIGEMLDEAAAALQKAKAQAAAAMAAAVKARKQAEKAIEIAEAYRDRAEGTREDLFL